MDAAYHISHQQDLNTDDRTLTLNMTFPGPQPCHDHCLKCHTYVYVPCLEGQGDFISRWRTPINHMVNSNPQYPNHQSTYKIPLTVQVQVSHKPYQAPTAECSPCRLCPHDSTPVVRLTKTCLAGWCARTGGLILLSLLLIRLLLGIVLLLLYYYSLLF